MSKQKTLQVTKVMVKESRPPLSGNSTNENTGPNCLGFQDPF